MSNARDISNLVTESIPSSLGTAGQLLAVNTGATAGEWVTPSVPKAPLLMIPFTDTGTWTAPVDCTVFVQAVGGGGSGTGVAQDDTANVFGLATSGGSAGYCEKELSVTAGTVLTITVGAGGTADSSIHSTANNGTNTGADGTATTVTGTGISLSAGGGTGGFARCQYGNATFTAAMAGGTGGTATGGDINVDGDDAHSFGANQVLTVTNGGGARVGYPALAPTLGFGVSTSIGTHIDNTLSVEFDGITELPIMLYSGVQSRAGGVGAFAGGTAGNTTVNPVDGIYGGGGGSGVCVSTDSSTGFFSVSPGNGGDGYAHITVISVD